MSMTERNPTEVARCGCPYDPEYDEGSLGWHLHENHPEMLAVWHSCRFREVSSLYPHLVAMAYDLDIAAADAASDEEVAARVAAYERAQGWEPRDWQAIGRDERADGGWEEEQ